MAIGICHGKMHRFTGAGNINVAATGESAGVMRRFTSFVLGGIPNTIESAVVMNRFTNAVTGTVAATGVCHGVMRRFKGGNGIRYNVSIKSRPLYAGPNIDNFGEVLNAVFNCEFREKISLLITLWSDYQRYLSDGNYRDNEKVISNQDAAGQPFFRQNISIVPLSGFVGTFFQYEIDKSLASNGFFKYFGADIKYIPKPALNPEFLSKLGSIQNGW
jgi:hypothetical protein